MFFADEYSQLIDEINSIPSAVFQIVACLKKKIEKKSFIEKKSGFDGTEGGFVEYSHCWR